LIADLKNKGL